MGLTPFICGTPDRIRRRLRGQLRAGELSIPPPSDKVASWPLIGLFIGAVILALAYELVLFWMDQNVAEEGPEAAVEE